MPLGIDEQSRDGISRKEEQDSRVPAQGSDSKPGEVEKKSEIDVEMGASTTSCQPTSVPASRLQRHVMRQTRALLSRSGRMFAEDDVPTQVEKSAVEEESRIESGEAKERCHHPPLSRVDQCQIQKLVFLYAQEKDEGPTLDLIVQKLEAIRQAASDAPKQHPALLKSLLLLDAFLCESGFGGLSVFFF